MSEGQRTSFKWYEHIPTMISVLAGVLLVGRILAVSGFDATTAMAILQSAGTTTVLVGAMLGFVIQAIPFAAFWILVLIFNGERRWATARPLDLFVFFNVMALFLIAAPAFELALMPLVAIGTVQAVKWLRKRYPSTPTPDETKARASRSYSREVILIGIAGFALSTGVLSPEPWLPSEAIRSTDNSIRVAYVLTKDDSDLVVLERDPRLVVRIKEDKIADRQLCTIQSSKIWDPLAKLLLIKTNERYPVCPGI